MNASLDCRSTGSKVIPRGDIFIFRAQTGTISGGPERELMFSVPGGPGRIRVAVCLALSLPLQLWLTAPLYATTRFRICV